MNTDHYESRRHFLIQALAAGFFFGSKVARAGVLGMVPSMLPPDQSVYSLTGDVIVNGKTATDGTTISAQDQITTGSNSQVIFVVGKDAFLLRENSSLFLKGNGLVIKGFRLLNGALLSVFGKSQHEISTPTAVIGIRGTGIYIEAQQEFSYICTCYGVTDISATTDPSHRVIVESKHHDAPKRVTADGFITTAPFVNHTDEELMLIETLVGRTPPFALVDDRYGGPRRY